MAHVEVRGQRLYCDRRGSGEPLLLIQGMTGNHLHWGEPFLSRLESDFELVLYDHRGIGRSDPVSGPFTIADLADDADALLDALDLESVHVLGISMGGMTAQELVLRHPERVRALVLGATAAGGEESERTDPEVVRRLGELIRAGRVGDAMREGFEFNVSLEFAADERNRRVFRDIAKELPMGMEIMLAQLQAVSSHDTSARLGEIDAPTLVIHGSADRILPVGNGRHLAGLIPGARLEVLEGVGHLFWWERPEESAAFVREHVSEAAARR